ncbi:unnamed protein product [Effrenium voratum]|nr:unnamed protein product [Effrenium voratum]
MRSQPLKLMLDQDCIRQLNTNTCEQGLGSCDAASASRQGVQPKRCKRSRQYCICNPQQQAKAEACYEVLGTDKLVGPNASVVCSSQGNNVRLITIPSDTPARLNILSKRQYPFTSYEYLDVQPVTDSNARLHLERVRVVQLRRCRCCSGRCPTRKL